MRIKSNLGLGRSTALTPAAIEESAFLRGGNSSERMVGHNGEMNASSVKELMINIAELAGRIQAGEFQEQTEVATAADRQETLKAAFADRTNAKWEELGASVALDVTDRVQRLGFARRVLARAEATQGAPIRIRSRIHNVDAVTAIGPTSVGIQVVRDNYIWPPEFYIIANLRIENKDLNQGSSDLLNEKFLEGLEAILVQEDRVLKNMMDRAVGMTNDIQYYTGSVTPALIGKMREQITRWNLPVAGMLLSNDVMTDFTTGSGFSAEWDPVSKLEILTTGVLGSIYGTEISTDGLRDPRLKVLNNGEIYTFTSPDMLGGYADRGPVESEARVNDGNFPAKGWFQHESMAMAIANNRGIAKAVRV